MTREASAGAAANSAEVRERLVEALNLDLIGPGAGHDLADERLPGWVRPSNWYLTGFLIPSGSPPETRADADEDDDLDEALEAGGLPEESAEERKAARKGFFPSSMGLSFLVAGDADALTVVVRWGDYAPEEVEGADGKSESFWRRRANERAVPVALPPARGDRAGGHDVPDPGGHAVPNSGAHVVPDSGGLALHVDQRPIGTEGLAGIPAGTRSVSVFLVNNRTPGDADPDRAYAFQAGIEIRGRRSFVPRPDPRGARAADWDGRVADLHYADTPEYATGHGVSADWDILDGACRTLRTAWIPRADVEQTKTAGVPGAELSMDALGALPDGGAAEAALDPLIDRYRAWIEDRRAEIATLPDGRRDTAAELLRLAALAADRMARGIAVLATDLDVLDAFRVANRAVARALRQRLPAQFAEHPPAWRAFQLAFILLNVPGLADPRDADRETVDLLFFPTGGGKTEAYLGLAALAMTLRRQRNPGHGGRHGTGVSVVMRYTLRLLTLDQLARASGLVCALELERAADPARYGEWPFEIGLWVGKAATPNFMGRKGDNRSDSARARAPASSRRTPAANPARCRSKAARGAGRGSGPTRSCCCRTTTPRKSCASPAPTSTASSAATGPCRSWPSTSRSTAACPRSSSRPSTSSRRCRGRRGPACCSAARTATTPAASAERRSRGRGGVWNARFRRRTSSSRTSCT